ncbi:hypothetical protein LWI28_018703 [Acer negundo]|uniref:Uncharacterized protein n=1 Tax=Acer negundo TaxID=4023 RepID=A0AAD5IM87_ACENE|nr:hypothetical protein LWI28_018703 [Acer negundo]
MLHFFILNPDLTPPYIWVVLQIQLLQNPDHRSPARSEPKSSGFSRTPTIFSSGRVRRQGDDDGCIEEVDEDSDDHEIFKAKWEFIVIS